MNKPTTTAAAILAFLLFTGCSSIQSVPKSELAGVSLNESGTAVAHITASYSGWYFLWLPILTGAQNPADGIVFARNTCNITTAAEAVTARAKKIGASGTINMVSTRDSSFILPIMPFFTWKTVTVSADAIR